MRRGWILAALAVVACRSGNVHDSESPMGFTLVSPFGDEVNVEWRARIGREVAAVSTFFGRSLPHPPVCVHLDAIDVPDDAGVAVQLDPRVEGLGGWATEDGDVHVIVGRAHGGLYSATAEKKLRHELTHVLLHRMGIDGPAWFHEGLAHEIEDVVGAGDGLAFHPAPVRLVLARGYLATVDVGELWTWGGHRTREPARESALRALASSLVRFLVEREGPDAWRDALPRLARMDPSAAPEIVAAWRSWLLDVDFTALVERGVGNPDPRIRCAAANALPALAEAVRSRDPGAPELGEAPDARSDQLALRILGDPACAEAAACYLVYFRARDLPASSVRELDRPGISAGLRLLGLALRARRGESVTEEEVRAVARDLTPDGRRLARVLHPFLPALAE